MTNKISSDKLQTKFYDLGYQLSIIETLARVLDVFINEPVNLEHSDCANLTSVLYEKIKLLHKDFEHIEQGILE